MRGGLGCRKFYVEEARRIESNLKANLPPGGYTAEEIEAGYQRLSDKFGFYSTLLFMEKETPYRRHELLGWKVSEFYMNLTYIAWQNYTAKKYGEIMKRKHETK